MNSNDIRILLVDDEQAIRNICKIYLSEIENVVIVGEAENVADAALLIKACKPDLVLLDVHLGKETGFDLLNQFQSQDFKVIFITAYEKYALSAIKAGALDYLLKPIDEDEFRKAIGKIKSQHAFQSEDIVIAQNAYETKKVERINLSAHDGYHLVWVKDILYCSANGNYTTFHLNNKKQIVISKGLKEYEELLPNDDFIRVHQSYLVNMNYVEKFSKDQSLILQNGEEVIVATRKKDAVIQWFKQIK